MEHQHPVFVVDTPSSRWSGGVVHGLGDPVAQARVLDRTVEDWRGGSLPDAGKVVGPAFVVGRDLWCSSRLLWSLEQASNVLSKGPSRLARRADGPARFADPLRRLPRSNDGSLILFDAWFVPAGHTLDALDVAALEAATHVDIVAPTFSMRLPADPEVVGQDGDLVLQLARTACAPVSHWVEVQRANLLALPTWTPSGSRVVGIARYLWAAFQVGSLTPSHVSQKLGSTGKNCRIHPSAVVEGSRLGDNVEVGPGAIIRGARIASNVTIGAQSLVELSVVGEGARIQRRAMVTASTVYPRARVGGILQLALCGQDASNKMFAVGTDMRLAGPVRVDTPDGLKDVDLGYMGVCFGHHSFVGSGVWIAPGRVIANGRQVTRTKEEMVM